MLTRLLFCVALLLCVSGQASAEEYPCQGTVRIIVPFGPASVTNVQTRIVAKYLELRLGRTVIVENMPGADGAIGAEYVSRVNPDGCTIFTLTNGLFGIGPMLGKKETFDLLKFTPISMMARNMQLLVVTADSPIKTVREYIANAAVNDTTYGTGNTSDRVSGALFSALAKAPIRQINYAKGEGGMMVDLLAKNISSAFSLTALGQVNAGKLRALAVMDDRRFPGLPDVSAIVELYPEFKDIARIAPHGTLAGPPGLPRAVAERLSREVCDILKLPDVVASFRKLGSEPICSTPDEDGQYLLRLSEDWPRIVREYKLQTPAN